MTQFHNLFLIASAMGFVHAAGIQSPECMGIDALTVQLDSLCGDTPSQENNQQLCVKLLLTKKRLVQKCATTTNETP